MAKKLKDKILDSEFTPPQWKFFHQLCEDYGWDLAQPLSWLLSVGVIGLPHSDFQQLLNLNSNEYQNLISKLIKTTIVEKVRFVRQGRKVGLRLDWETLEDRYGKLPFCTSQQQYNALVADRNASGVPSPQKNSPTPELANNSISEGNIKKRLRPKPTAGPQKINKFLKINIQDDLPKREKEEVGNKINELLEKHGLIGKEERLNYSRKNNEDENDSDDLNTFSDQVGELGTEFATRDHAQARVLLRARAAMYNQFHLISIYKYIIKT